MILFVFEGAKVEPKVFDSIGRLFLSGEELRIVSCGFDLPTLYSRLQAYGEDLFRSLPLKENGIEIPEGKRSDTMFSQVFLFFDYDFQNRIGLEVLNGILDEMLEFFSDETENGKLYINYPMVEALKYTKELPDKNYSTYLATRKECVNHFFKRKAEAFAFTEAKGYRFIDLAKTPQAAVVSNWFLLDLQNVSKANYIVGGSDTLPESKDDISQQAIFDAQKSKFVVPSDCVSILSAFPLFLYDYLKHVVAGDE